MSNANTQLFRQQKKLSQIFRDPMTLDEFIKVWNPEKVKPSTNKCLGHSQSFGEIQESKIRINHNF